MLAFASMHLYMCCNNWSDPEPSKIIFRLVSAPFLWVHHSPSRY